jgi:AcrR family transcriptional regulator
MAPAPGTTARRRSAGERREQLVAAAVPAFAVGGLHGTAVSSVTSAVGVTQPYAFSLFGTKKGLFLASLEHGFDHLEERFRTAAEGLTGEDAMGSMGESYVALLEDRDWLLLQLQGYAACDDPEVRAASSDGYAGLWELVGRVSGAPEEEVRAFFATGMLLNVAAAMDLPQIAGDPGWALAHLRAAAKAAADG